MRDRSKVNDIGTTFELLPMFIVAVMFVTICASILWGGPGFFLAMGAMMFLMVLACGIVAMLKDLIDAVQQRPVDIMADALKRAQLMADYIGEPRTDNEPRK